MGPMGEARRGLRAACSTGGRASTLEPASATARSPLPICHAVNRGIPAYARRKRRLAAIARRERHGKKMLFWHNASEAAPQIAE